MESYPAKISFDALQKACSTCSFQELCIPVGVGIAGLTALDNMVESLGPLHKGEYLFRQGDVFSAIYAVRSGYFKTYVDNEQGESHVLGFYMAGELLGLGSISQGSNQCSAETLDTGMVCRLPFAELGRISQAVPELQSQLLRLMSRDMVKAQVLSFGQSVEVRMAAFLLDWGERLARRGFSQRHFVLPMSRQDIGSYLRLTPETISRCIGHFSERHWIEIRRREVRLIDNAALVSLRNLGLGGVSAGS